MSEPNNIINYHSDNLTHILHCDQCKEVHLWRLGIMAGIFAVVGIAYLISCYISNKRK